MNYFKSILCLIAFTAVSITQTSAHALFIATAEEAALNQPHQVKIYYSELGKKDLVPTAKWENPLTQFHLYLITPDGKRKQLTTHPSEYHFTGQFTPTQKGIYNPKNEMYINKKRNVHLNTI